MKKKFNGPRAVDFSGMYAPATVVLFAGLGGVCIGIEQAYVEAGFPDRYVDLAVNHWDTAVAVHKANHPMTDHKQCSVWEVDPAAVLLGRKIAYLHASPDCVDFSKAKGSAPKRKHIRALADVVLVWAAKRQPTVITIENVEEFKQWGPLLPNGQPDPARRGQEFQRWCRELRAMGYVVDHREIRASDIGVPTTRKRLHIIARCDGKQIIFPEKTHGKDAGDQVKNGSGDEGRRGRPIQREAGTSDYRGGLRDDGSVRSSRSSRQKLSDWPRNSGDCATAPLKAVHTAAECIDWSIPMLSIFSTAAEAKAFGKRHGIGTPRRPLKPKTLARLAGGALKFVLKAEKPFVVDIQNFGWNSTETRDPSQPMPTVTGSPKGGGFAVVDAEVSPYVTRVAHGDNSAGGKRWGNAAHSVDEPLGTVAASKDFAVSAAKLSAYTAGVGGRAGQSPSTSLEQPLPTVTGKGDRVVVGATLAPLISRYNGSKGGESRCKPVDEPVTTLDTQNRIGVVAAALSRDFGNSDGADVSRPVPTTTGTNHTGVIAASLSPFTVPNLGERDGQSPRSGSIDAPLPTVTGTASGASLAAVTLTTLNHSGPEHRSATPGEPLATITGANDARAVVAAMVVKHYTGVVGSSMTEPLDTVTATDHNAVACAHLVKFRGDSKGNAANEPVPTVTSGGGSARDAGAAHAMGVSLAYLSHFYTSNTCGGAGDPREPAKTITSGGQHSAVTVATTAPTFISAFYGEGSGKTGHSPAEPMPTVVSKDRFQLTSAPTSGWPLTEQELMRAKMVARFLIRELGRKVDGNLIWVRDTDRRKVFPLVRVLVDGHDRILTDLLMRMFAPRELAKAQGFPDYYVIDRTSDGKPVSKADQVKLVGNSVCPEVAKQIAKLNVVDQRVFEDAMDAQRLARESA